MATDEASLLAALRRGEPVTLEPGTVIRLTRTLLICEDSIIAAAGGPGDAPRIEGPQGEHAVNVYGATLRLRGVAVAASKNSSAVRCEYKGRAELAGCALSSPDGNGLYVRGGATAEVQGGTIADCVRGVRCYESGSKATVRTARPRTAETAR